MPHPSPGKLRKKGSLQEIQDFFDDNQIDFNIHFFMYLLEQTIRLIGYAPDEKCFNYPMNTLKVRLRHANKQKHAVTLITLYDAIARLATCYYYLKTVLGPLTHATYIRQLLFDAIDIETTLPDEDTRSMKLCLQNLLFSHTSLLYFLKHHQEDMHFPLIISMIKDYKNPNNTPCALTKHFCASNIKAQISMSLTYDLSMACQISEYIHLRHQKSDWSFSFFGGHSKAAKLGGAEKLCAYLCGRSVQFDDRELLAMLEQPSKLRTVLSDFYFSFPRKIKIVTEPNTYVSFPPLSELDHSRSTRK